jgi:hypothetical protein
VKTMCALCFEFRRIKYLSGTPVHFCTYSGTSRLVYEATIKYVTSEACGLKSQGHFQVANIINSNWIGEVFQLQYCYVTLIRCVCVCQPIQRYRHVVQFVLKTAEHNIRSGTEQATCFGHQQAITKNIKQQSLNTAV